VVRAFSPPALALGTAPSRVLQRRGRGADGRCRFHPDALVVVDALTQSFCPTSRVPSSDDKRDQNAVFDATADRRRAAAC
jgi:hypothetical protein